MKSALASRFKADGARARLCCGYKQGKRGLSVALVKRSSCVGCCSLGRDAAMFFSSVMVCCVVVVVLK